MNKAKPYIDYVEKYLNGPKEVHVIELPELLEELKNYSPYKWSNKKAERIYYLCLETGKSKLARDIFHLYGNGKPDDLTMATVMAIYAQEQSSKL